MNLVRLWKNLDTTKGGSYNINTGELNPDQGYMVAIAGHEKKYPIPKSFAEFSTIIENYLYNNDKIDILAEKEHAFLGLWIDGNILYVDISEQIFNKSTAILRGIRNKQKSIYDNAIKQVIWL